MVELLLGMIGMVLVLAAFLAGIYFGHRKGKRYVSAPSDDNDGMTQEQIKRHRQELKATQEAFQQMQGYNAEIAYAMKKNTVEKFLSEEEGGNS